MKRVSKVLETRFFIWKICRTPSTGEQTKQLAKLAEIKAKYLVIEL